MTTFRFTRRVQRRLALGLCLVASMAVLSAAGAGNRIFASQGGNSATTAYSYYYFKEERRLSLDATRIAVLRAPDQRGSGEAMPDLSPYGLDVSAVEPMAVQRWSFVKTTAPAWTDIAVRDAVSQIAGRELVDFVSPVFLDDAGDPVVITPHILVGFDRSLDPARAEAILAASGAGRIVDRDWANMTRAYRLESDSHDGFEVLAAANRLAQRPDVMFAEPDMMVTAHLVLTPNDTYFPHLWGLHNDGTFPIFCGALNDFDMDAPEAWDITTGDPSIIVAILDCGVQLDHPDLNLYTPGFDPTGEGGGGGPVNVCDVHGTWVAGCVSGTINNNLGIVGIAPGVRSASARVIVSSLTCNGTGIIAASWVVDALAWAETIEARITNCSWFRNTPSSAIDQKFADTRANGMLHFVAAGNSALSTISYPASLPSVNAVAALDPCGNRAVFSNYGVGLDFSAPGHYGISTDRTGSAGGNDGINDGGCLPAGTLGCNSDGDCGPGGTCLLVHVDYALVAGTSFASPYAAGVAALVLSLKPELTADQVQAVLQQSAVDLGPEGYDTDYGWGFVNAANALGTAVLTAVQTTPKLPQGFVLLGNRPNPFDARTNIEYELAGESTVQLRIFDVAGRLVSTTPVRSESAGMHQFMWDGTDGTGSKVAAGVYFFELRVNGASQAKKGILLR